MTARLLTAAALSALLALPAIAQDQSPPADPNAPPPASHHTTPSTAADPLPTDPATGPIVGQAATPASGVVLQSSPTPPDQAYRLKAGDPSVVSNGPIPDTAENRAKYGAPISNGGKRTTPAGN